MRMTLRQLTFDVHVDGPVNGPAVVLLHGFPQRALLWDRVVPVLHGAGLRTVAPDQRGYSPGARPAEVAAYRLSECVADVLALLDELDLTGAHLVGHDWGALVAWQLASRYPDRVRSLTAVSVPHPLALAGALAGDPEQRERSAYVALFREPGKAEQVLLAHDAARLRAMFAGCPAERVDRYVEPMLAPGALTGALNWYRAMSTRDTADLAPCPVPTTFVWGDQDVAIGARAARDCAKYVTGPYELLALSGVSHWVPDQVPDELAAAVLARVSAEQTS